MKKIKENLETINKEISHSAEKAKRKPEDITIIGVSKRHSVETIQNGIKAGIKTFGENYINEAVSKIDHINNPDLSWHFIGHLQSNKAKFAVKYFDLIHTVDTIKLATGINKQANKINKIQDILIQINISEEESKSGITSDEACLLAEKISSLEHVRLKGIMGMPPFSPDPEDAREYFIKLKKIKDYIDNQNIPSVTMKHLSMGMSQDFNVAVEEGSTMVRIGTKLFGQRK